MPTTIIRTTSILALLGLAGCSFINDWGKLTTGRGPDAGMPIDGAPVIDAPSSGDAPMSIDDAPMCNTTCDTACEPMGQLCLPDTMGCAACRTCAGCDPLTCRGRCVVASADMCRCDTGAAEGMACGGGIPCLGGLDCLAGLCQRPCKDARSCIHPDYLACGSAGHCISDRGQELRRCTADGRCDMGLACVNDRCFRRCTTDSECPAELGASCVDYNMDFAFECIPSLGCDVVTGAGCGPGRICRFFDADLMSGRIATACFSPVDTLPRGASCPVENRCATGLECLQLSDGEMPTCRQFCWVDDATACGMGSMCTALSTGTVVLGDGVRTLGICS